MKPIVISGAGLYDDLKLSTLPIYIFAPLLGGVMAGVFQLLNGKVAKTMKESAEEENWKVLNWTYLNQHLKKFIE